ncbi:MAG: 7-cyano-7-deazaguanine synthase QueC [Gammaproteobacteria bacterium]|uniref:7-cyano-7-deazaguanine synthase QueC n=1 Tax=Hydrogenophaga sp. TaxID=1904254 RepID=UPI0025B850CD|nr:7-cyano-7-deazaguanine synthase QueC [Hydrogenophaga sp.]MBU4184147.1 7-cyano-7-deazaguanine synthase QueC [Gammaproteobacteria bacterium]MBU4279097.1 7-cyano-7-deazaguanine synthase QueC [Gammaproteobacteria bacterium]MBU4324781.1 7-cyano-7-deazaguanine synthase QueC [Gammaproteobacteria bacterium]MBU4507526.1 7-cyano-7-deazaguanine synthase QueC [Gammaproteobacteria bacterium]MCG2657554.1 7-cyano-7-deazaguanine synthase QueC [Hydrogenophaga sp.]
MNPSPTSAPHHTSALVLFSGGQDSTTCLVHALARYPRVETLGFDYGQRHSVELQARLVVLRKLRERFPAWSERLGEDHMLDLAVLGKVSETSLTRDMAFRMEESGLPNTFVPGRNLLFLTLAAALAYRRGIQVIVTGVCETDFSGYPDCRDDTMKALQVALSLGMDHRFLIDTPLMWIDKAETWRMAEALGQASGVSGGGQALVDLIVEHTHTCYLGDREHRQAWGYGCGSCPACELRARGWAGYSAAD